MPLYDFGCAHCGARFERALPLSADCSRAACTCGAEATRVQTGFALGGRASTGDLDRRALPHSLQGVGFSRERVAELQRREEAMERREQRHPELAQQRRVVVEHEGGSVRYAPNAAAAPVSSVAPPATASATAAGAKAVAA